MTRVNFETNTIYKREFLVLKPNYLIQYRWNQTNQINLSGRKKSPVVDSDLFHFQRTTPTYPDLYHRDVIDNCYSLFLPLKSMP